MTEFTGAAESAAKDIHTLIAMREFVQLSRELNKFNVFRLLRIEDYEIRHSTFLSYLLNPHESHGVGTAFLQNFLLRVFLRNENDVDTNTAIVPVISIFDLDLHAAQVDTEFRFGPHITKIAGDGAGIDDDENDPSNRSLDILIRIPLRSRNNEDFVIAIENKINSKMGDNQLQNYRSRLTTQFGTAALACVYLTVRDDEARVNGWLPVTYHNIVYPALEQTLEAFGNRINKDVCVLMQHYLDALAEKVNPEAASIKRDQLASAIFSQLRYVKTALQQQKAKRSAVYLAHRHECDFLLDYDADPRSKAFNWFRTNWSQMTPVREAIERHHLRLIIDDSVRDYMRFLPVTAGSTLDADVIRLGGHKEGDQQRRWTNSGRAILFEIKGARPQLNEVDDPGAPTKFSLHIMVGPLANLDRHMFVDGLRERLALLQRGDGGTEKPRWVAKLVSFKKTRSDNFSTVLKHAFFSSDIDGWQREMSEPDFLDFLQQASQIIGEYIKENEANCRT